MVETSSGQSIVRRSMLDNCSDCFPRRRRQSQRKQSAETRAHQNACLSICRASKIRGGSGVAGGKSLAARRRGSPEVSAPDLLSGCGQAGRVHRLQGGCGDKQGDAGTGGCGDKRLHRGTRAAPHSRCMAPSSLAPSSRPRRLVLAPILRELGVPMFAPPCSPPSAIPPPKSTGATPVARRDEGQSY